MLCEQLLSRECHEGLEAVRNGLGRCVAAAASASAQRVVLLQDFPMDDPARLVRLLAVLIQGGNEPVCTRIRQATGASCESACAALASHLEVLFLIISFLKRFFLFSFNNNFTMHDISCCSLASSSLSFCFTTKLPKYMHTVMLLIRSVVALRVSAKDQT